VEEAAGVAVVGVAKVEVAVEAAARARVEVVARDVVKAAARVAELIPLVFLTRTALKAA